MKWTKEKLILSFKTLEEKLGARPTMKQFLEDVDTPSNMPIRQQFGNWTGFVKAMGLEPIKPSFSELAKQNKVKALKGKKGGNNKGGRYKDHRGYVQLWKPEHPNSPKSGYLMEHRFVMSEHLGRPLLTCENVHHKNGIRSDNRIENLELWETTQPSGQRVEDKIEWAIEFFKRYGYKTVKV